MKLSVIIPAYNEEKNLPKIIKALRNQSFKDFKIIVVDNNSKDKTLSLSKKLADKTYECKEQGISPSRNYGAFRAKTELVAFLDADTIPSKDWAKTVQNSFEKDRNLSAITGLDLYEWDNFFIRSFLNFFARLIFYHGKVLNFFGKPTIIANNFAIKTPLFKKLGGFDKLIVEDAYFNKKLQKINGVKCRCDKNMLIECSSRRFRKAGILKTYYLWFKASFKEISIENYKRQDEMD